MLNITHGPHAHLQAAATQVTVVTAQPVVVQRPVFRDYPVVVTLENGQQVNYTSVWQ